MKFCKKCEKNTPTSTKMGIEECMVCGTELSESKIREIIPKMEFILKLTPEIKQKVTDIKKSPDIPNYEPNYRDSLDYFPSSGAILGGIMVMIVGFATLTIGNYLIITISGSLESIGNPTQNMSWGMTTIGETSEIINYLTAAFPLFGLALMILGFATVLFSLRGSVGGDY